MRNVGARPRGRERAPTFSSRRYQTNSSRRNREESQYRDLGARKGRASPNPRVCLECYSVCLGSQRHARDRYRSSVSLTSYRSRSQGDLVEEEKDDRRKAPSMFRKRNQISHLAIQHGVGKEKQWEVEDVHRLH